ncbi:hypothetical protein MKZ38_000528 [Zalerion maritima]|uniref:Uncharacterized protein n=1 Tax=Zalerion maritima TaxID=339359 RepID=A0AAD5WTV7_9PEZI|nr:hypothetical protein MKZ38_000528 [Zalerion maritima]
MNPTGSLDSIPLDSKPGRRGQHGHARYFSFFRSQRQLPFLPHSHPTSPEPRSPPPLKTSQTANPRMSGHDRPGRRRPFSTWMKKLAGFKNNSSDGSHGHGHSRRILYQMKAQGSKRPSKNNNPYPQSGRIGAPHIHNSLPSFSTGPSGVTSSTGSLDRSLRSSVEGRNPPTTGARSTIAPTVCTDHEASHSMMAPSHAGASTVGTRTVGGHESRRGGDSTFSSPSPSVRSLTTTLTTIQSLADNNANANTNNPAPNPPHHTQNHTQTNSIQFTQPFPTASMSTPSPVSAIPAHLALQPTTYSTATANNLLTDNASILTLASSSKRRRRRSFDTDASVRALAPSSLWGGSRESLPLSVLSANIGAGDGSGMPPGGPGTPSGLHSSSRMAERTSIYSATGIAPALNSERNSFYANAKQSSIAGGVTGDGCSVRSGYGHTRADSTTGSIAGLNSPLASPREANVLEKDEGEEELGKNEDEEKGKVNEKERKKEKAQD